MNRQSGRGMLLAAIFFAALIPSKAFTVEKMCAFCHADHGGKGGGTLLKKDINELCAGCHQERLDKGEHKVGMKPAKPVAGVPLQDNRMTCISCHDPHSKSPAMLRMPSNKLCILCHEK